MSGKQGTVQSNSSQEDFAAALERLWAENPELLEQAIADNPNRFARQNPGAFTAEATQPVSPGFDADAYVADMNIATLENLLVYGPNLPGYGDRKAAIQAAQDRLASLLSGQTPTGHGMGPDGYPVGTTPTDYDPGDVTGTHEIPIPDGVVDYGPGSDNDIDPWTDPPDPPSSGPDGPGPVPTYPEGVVVPDPGGVDGETPIGGDTPDTGGAPDSPSADNPLLGAFEGPIPGSWGPNEDFYKHQFGRLLQQEDMARQQAWAAALRREQEQQNPQQSPLDTSWGWADLPEIRTNDAPPGSNEAWSWGFNPAYDVSQDMTNQEVFQAIAGGLSPQQQAWVQENFQQSPQGASGTFWANAGDPSAIINAIDPGAHPDWRGTIEDIANLLYTREDLTTPAGGGPATPPPGYAAPR